MSRPRAPAAIAAAGLVALLLGIVPNGWFVGAMTTGFGDEDDRRIELSFGLTEVEACSGTQCGEMAYRGMPGPGEGADGLETSRFRELRRFVWAGAATFWGGVMVAIAIGAALLQWSIRQRLPVSPATIAGALAIGVAIAGVVTFAIRPDMKYVVFMSSDFDLRTSFGMPLTLLGCAGCAVGGFLLARAEPRGPARITSVADALEAPLPAAGRVSPACPKCSAPTLFVSEHQRHFCSSCRLYL